jgi:hypothetical protein
MTDTASEAVVPEAAADAELVAAFERFINEILDLLGGGGAPYPPSTPGQIVTGALMGKILRLADATLALARTHHPNDTGPTLRTMLNLYVNLKFICKHASPDAAAMRFMSHIEHLRKRMEKDVVRPDRANEGFPVMSTEAWEEDEAVVRRHLELIEEWGRDNGVKAMPLLGQPKKPKKKNRNTPPTSWSGLSDAALFGKVGEKDAYRLYAFFSNEIHGNIAGIGEVVTSLNAGSVAIADVGEPIVAPLALASKYVILSVDLYKDYLGLKIDDAALQRTADDFAADLRRYPRPAKKQKAAS